MVRSSLPSAPGAYRYDLHLHSDASPDCKTALRTLIRMARRRGLTGIAVTDHDTVEGARRLAAIWPHDELQLITGCERTLGDGSHVIGLFVQNALEATTLRELVAEIHGQGALVYVPHPFRRYSGVAGEASKQSPEDLEWLWHQADLIEVFNPKCTAEENRWAVELVQKLGKPFTASSDGHRAFEIGMACTVFSAPLSPATFRSSAVYAPPKSVARKIIALKRDEPSGLRKSVRALLQSAGLLATVKSVRDSLRCYKQPKLEKFL